MDFESMMKASRRDFLSGTLQLAAAGALGLDPALARPADSLQERALRRGLTFGAAVTSGHLRSDLPFRDAVLRECGVLVPEWEMKWKPTERIRGQRAHEAGDWLAGFAAEHGLALRGHTPIWYRGLPDWVPPALAEGDGRGVVRERVRDLMTRYKGRVREWDVVNEAVEPRHGRPDGLRDSPLLRSLGPAYITEAFRAARAADPSAVLVYNEYDIEFDTPPSEARRKAVLALLRTLRRDSLVDALGIQSHLVAHRPFNPQVFRRFLAEVAGLGLGIVLTELDVIDTRLPADPVERDRAAADYAARYLDVALDEKAVTGVLTWGLSDRYTWVTGDSWHGRKDGLPSRPLPYDAELRRKPLWNAIGKAFDHAPDRRGP